ncbi:mitochondrial biogenesis AIM24-domain-containing protein [Kalaharituber pfeilii]|nr:mitochondrial biogenesis AIM24-domain-containing protein [Kalaharituber pfeilii]
MASSRRISPVLKWGLVRPVGSSAGPRHRSIHVSAAPSTSSIHPPTDLSAQTRAVPKLSGAGPFPQDVQFENLGAPYSLLSVSLPSSAALYSRRGTLVGMNGRVENVVSTLSILGPLRRSMLGIPFLYQRIISTSPLTCLISTNTPYTSFAVIALEGTVDWTVAQKDSLLAWAGHSISVKPTVHRMMSLSHWGNSQISGRGLVALVGKGQLFQVVLQDGEEFIVHPNNLLAYSRNTPKPPQPYRLQSSSLKLQIPRLSDVFPQMNFGKDFFHAIASTKTYQVISTIVWKVRIWSRRIIWGDREFLQFQGPVTILIQSRASKITDIITKQEAQDVAVTEPETLAELEKQIDRLKKATHKANSAPKVGLSPAALKTATVVNGKVELTDSDLREFIKT